MGMKWVPLSGTIAGVIAALILLGGSAMACP